MYLKDVIKDIIYKDEQHEFTVTLNSINQCSWLKNIAGFANYKGGDYYIGVNDITQQVSGFSINELDDIKCIINNNVSKHLFPKPHYTIELIDCLINKEIKTIICIHIFESLQKPIVLKIDDISMIFIRKMGTTVGADIDEIQNMVKSCIDNYNFDGVITNKNYKKEDFDLLYDYYLRTNIANPDYNFIDKIGLINKHNKLTNAGLLFRDNYKADSVILKLNCYSGLHIDKDNTDSSEYNCNILQCLDHSLNFINKRINTSSYPQLALKDAIISAFAYKDYNNSEYIEINLFSNRIEVSVPGKLIKYNGESIRLYNLSNISPINTNPLISKVLFELKLLKTDGKIFNEIENQYINAKKFYKPFIYIESNRFTIVLPNLSDKTGVAVGEHHIVVYPELKTRSNYDDEIVSMCYKRKLKAQEIAQELNISYSTYLIKDILGNLVNNEILIKLKEDNNTVYTTNDKIIKTEN